MKRVIKFRGKRIDNGEWVYGDLIHGVKSKKGKLFILPENINQPGCDYLDGFDVIPESVGQFTGLTDKNGKEIYEGDIFNLGDKNILYIVEYFDCGLSGRQNGNRSRVGLAHWNDRIEVVGNIHDNPELLNK